MTPGRRADLVRRRPRRELQRHPGEARPARATSEGDRGRDGRDDARRSQGGGRGERPLPQPGQVFLRQPRSVSRAPTYMRTRTRPPEDASSRGVPAALSRTASIWSSTSSWRIASCPPTASYAARETRMSRPRRSRPACGASGREARRDEGADQHRGSRLHRPLDHPVRLEHREERQTLGPAAARAESTPHGIGRVTDVGIGEKQPLPTRPLEALVARPRLADPPGGHRLPTQHLHPIACGGARLRRRRVRRLVVDDDHLERAVLLLRQGGERRIPAPRRAPGR